MKSLLFDVIIFIYAADNVKTDLLTLFVNNFSELNQVV